MHKTNQITITNTKNKLKKAKRVTMPPKKKKVTKQRPTTNEEKNDSEKENSTKTTNNGVTVMSPVVANMILATMGHHNNLDSDMDSITGNEAFEKASKIATYQRVIHTLNNEIRGELFTTTKNQPVENVELQKSYVTHCKMNGIIDTDEDITEAVKRVTKKFGWKNYKILHTDDWKWDSDFAEFIMNKLGLLGNEGQQDGRYRSQKWDVIKKDVSTSMQAVKSSATQSMKRGFF